MVNNERRVTFLEAETSESETKVKNLETRLVGADSKFQRVSARVTELETELAASEKLGRQLRDERNALQDKLATAVDSEEAIGCEVRWHQYFYFFGRNIS